MASLRSVPFIAGVRKAASCYVETISTFHTMSNGFARPLSPLISLSQSASKLPMGSRITAIPKYSSLCIQNPNTTAAAALACPTNIPHLTHPQQLRRWFTTSQVLPNNNQSNNNSQSPPFGEQFSLRLINENGFLSWTRNSYLSAAVGATILNGAANEDVIQHAGILVLLVSAMNMTWGSACHFTNLIRIRDRCAMSRPVLLLNLIGCFFHALLWLVILGSYIKYSGYADLYKKGKWQRGQCEMATEPTKDQ